MFCEVGKRCKKHLTCRDCAESWQRREFKTFCEGTKIPPNGILTYFVIKTQKRGGLGVGLNEIYKVIDDIREEVKRGRLKNVFFGRLEVSFSQSLGFNPHLNLLVYGDVTPFLVIFLRYNLSVYRRIKENSATVARSIVWYMLKFNSLGYDKGEIVRQTLNKRQTVINSRHFKGLGVPDDVRAADIDYSFLKPCPIRYREEIDLRAAYSLARRKERDALKAKILAVRLKYERSA